MIEYGDAHLVKMWRTQLPVPSHEQELLPFPECVTLLSTTVTPMQ